MESLEELVLKQIIRTQENEVAALKEKIAQLEKDTKDKNNRLWDIVKQRDPKVIECNDCKMTYGYRQCSECKKPYCSDCISFEDDEEMSYTCYTCANRWW